MRGYSAAIITMVPTTRSPSSSACWSFAVHKLGIVHKSQGAGIALHSSCTFPVQDRGMNYGYARVSTDHQSLAAQVERLTAEGCAKVYQETASSSRADRAALKRAVDRLAAGDVLIVTRLDRLARSTRDLLNTLAAITAKGAGFRSLADAWADTTTPHGRLMLTILGGLAEFERELIRARTGEGLERARKRGVLPGPKPKLTLHQQREALARREAGESCAEIGRSYNVSHSTISRLKAKA
jgi:DNA invertase Pin-like site-specific DNA recombinase